MNVEGPGWPPQRRVPWRRRSQQLADRALQLLWTRATGLPAIRHVQIQTQSRCNADCVFCPYVESWHAAHPGRMSDALFTRVLEQLQPFARLLQRGTVHLYLMSEPLLDRQLGARIAEVYRRLPGTRVELSSNGLALSDRVIETLIHALAGRRHTLSLSIHGVDQHSLRRTMNLDHQRIQANVLKLLRRAGGRLRVELLAAGQALDGRVRFFDEQLFVDRWLDLLRREGIPRRGLSLHTFRFHDRAGGLRRDERDARALDLGVRRPIDALRRQPCWRVDQWLHVLHDGTLRLCCMDYHGEVALPNLAEIELLDHLRSPAYRALVERVHGRAASAEAFICRRCASPGG